MRGVGFPDLLSNFSRGAARDPEFPRTLTPTAATSAPRGGLAKAPGEFYGETLAVALASRFAVKLSGEG